jgi:hypothetical protein
MGAGPEFPCNVAYACMLPACVGCASSGVGLRSCRSAGGQPREPRFESPDEAIAWLLARPARKRRRARGFALAEFFSMTAAALAMTGVVLLSAWLKDARGDLAAARADLAECVDGWEGAAARSTQCLELARGCVAELVQRDNACACWMAPEVTR